MCFGHVDAAGSVGILHCDRLYWLAEPFHVFPRGEPPGAVPAKAQGNVVYRHRFGFQDLLAYVGLDACRLNSSDAHQI